MRNIIILLGVLVIGAVGFLFYQDKSEIPVAEKETSVTKVGFVYLTTPGDHGWTYAHELGKQMVEKKFGKDVKVSVVENVPEGPDATRVIRAVSYTHLTLPTTLVV